MEGPPVHPPPSLHSPIGVTLFVEAYCVVVVVQVGVLVERHDGPEVFVVEKSG